jgi:hypothetical protein
MFISIYTMIILHFYGIKTAAGNLLYIEGSQRTINFCNLNSFIYHNSGSSISKVIKLSLSFLDS